MFQHILVPLDGSSLAECVLPHIVALARVYDARVTVCHVVEQGRHGDEQPVDAIDWYLRKAEADVYLDDTVAQLQREGVEATALLLEGYPADRLIDYARRGDVDLILCSTHGQGGVATWKIGSVAQKVIMSAGTSAMLVRSSQSVGKRVRYRRILIPLDCSQRAEHVLPLAHRLAAFHQAQLWLVHVVDKPEMPRRAPLTTEDVELANEFVDRNSAEARRYLESLRQQLSVDVETEVLVSDDVTATLHALARDTDLVVTSAHGYSACAQWPHGSVTTSFIMHGETPLLAVQDLPLSESEQRQTAPARHYRKE